QVGGIGEQMPPVLVNKADLFGKMVYKGAQEIAGLGDGGALQIPGRSLGVVRLVPGLVLRMGGSSRHSGTHDLSPGEAQERCSRVRYGFLNNGLDRRHPGWRAAFRDGPFCTCGTRKRLLIAFKVSSSGTYRKGLSTLSPSF